MMIGSLPFSHSGPAAASGVGARAGAGEGGRKAGDATSQQNPANDQELQELKKRDREVRAHEAAHLAAAGHYATSGMSFTYQRGSDGQQYAVGGEVSIDTSPVPNDPEATLRKAQIVQRAALAPADPSSQDRQVAAQAAQMAAQAQIELSTGNSGGAQQAAPAAAPDKKFIEAYLSVNGNTAGSALSLRA